MGEILKRRLKQAKFASPQHEAILNLIVAANHISERIARVCGEFGLSEQQYNILRILKGAYPDGHRCGEIAVRMLDRSPDVTRRIDALEKQQLVERARPAEDRRVVVTRITGKGLDLVERMQPKVEEVQQYVGSRLTDEECRELSRLCENLYGDDV